jgi:hypothetical protein
MPRTIDADSDSFPVSERNRVRRLHERGRYDRASIYPILDAAMICHIAYVIDGQPYCTPMPSGGRTTTCIGTVRRPVGCCGRSVTAYPSV